MTKKTFLKKEKKITANREKLKFYTLKYFSFMFNKMSLIIVIFNFDEYTKMNPIIFSIKVYDSNVK